MNEEAQHEARHVRDGEMLIDWDVPIEMDDGVVLRADVFRPVATQQSPVLMSFGPYGKGLTWTAGVYGAQWHALVRDHPDVLNGSSGRYQSWETPDPERWVPWGYAVVRIDSRGAGRSGGYLDPFSPREVTDLERCITWAGTRGWSTGKVGLSGISYYAAIQWLVAARNPPNLAAMCPWEGFADMYRDGVAHGGIPSTFWPNWLATQIAYVQHGVGRNGPTSPFTGELVGGPHTVSEQRLVENRRDLREAILHNPLYNEFWKARSADWSKVSVPFLTGVNWGGQGLHPRGGYAAFEFSQSPERWLEVHGLEHWTHYYTDYGVGLQRRFFDYYLKNLQNGWDSQPPVILQVRHVSGFEQRNEYEWPLARTNWTPLYLDLSNDTLTAHAPGAESSKQFDAFTERITLRTEPFEAETEITGPLSAKLFARSSTEDIDIFVVLHLLSPDNREVTFPGTVDPHTPIAQGWLRGSHRKVDPDLTRSWQPYHPHDEIEPLVPDTIYEFDIEIIPTSIVVPIGYRIGLSVRGCDYTYEGDLGEMSEIQTFANIMSGCGPFLHEDPEMRPANLYGGRYTVHSGGRTASYILAPIITDPREGYR